MLNDQIFAILNDIKNNKANQNRCFECSLIYPNFISANIGVFLCFVCANVHKKHLPEKISKIIEIIPINIYDIQNSLDYFFCGGNKRFSDLLEVYDLKPTAGSDFSDDKIIIEKYKTKAVSYYRTLLENEVKGVKEGSEAPNFEEGRELDENLKNLNYDIYNK